MPGAFAWRTRRPSSWSENWRSACGNCGNSRRHRLRARDGLFGGRQPLHVLLGRDLGAQHVLAAALAERGPAARRLGEQRELVEILLDHRRQREVHVFMTPWIVPDLLPDAPALPGQPRVDLELLPALDGQLVVEDADRLDLHAVAAVAAVFQAHDAAFQRMNTLGLEHDLEHGHEDRKSTRLNSSHGYISY